MELTEYSATETLRDGRPIEIRALRPADRDGLLGALDRMSDESIHRRFFGPKRHFSDDEVAYYTNVDFTDHVALVAVLEEDGRALIVGGGALHRLEARNLPRSLSPWTMRTRGKASARC